MSGNTRGLKSYNLLVLNLDDCLLHWPIYARWIFDAERCEDLSRFTRTECLLQGHLRQSLIDQPSRLVREKNTLVLEVIALPIWA
jgi:hypothetical protein